MTGHLNNKVPATKSQISTTAPIVVARLPPRNEGACPYRVTGVIKVGPAIVPPGRK